MLDHLYGIVVGLGEPKFQSAIFRAGPNQLPQMRGDRGRIDGRQAQRSVQNKRSDAGCASCRGGTNYIERVDVSGNKTFINFVEQLEGGEGP